MAIWATEDLATITSYIDGLTINSADDWRAAWPGGDDTAIQTADIDLHGAIEDMEINETESEVILKIVYRATETADEETGEIDFTTEEINKTWPIAVEE